MHAKYEVSMAYGSKVMAKVNVLPQSQRQTGQKQDAPKFHSGGIKSGGDPDIYTLISYHTTILYHSLRGFSWAIGAFPSP